MLSLSNNSQKNESAIVELQPIKKMCLEKYNDFPEMGRFAVRDMGRTVAVGIVKDIEVGIVKDVDKGA